MSPLLSWSLGAVVLVALSAVLTGLAGSTDVAFAAGAVTLLVVGALWRLWSQDRLHEPSPISEHLAVGYSWAFYASLVFTWNEVGERWVDWLILIPPISVIPPIVRALVRRSSSPDRTAGILRVLHRLVAAVFFLSGAFFVLTVLGMVVAPVPLIAGVLHLVAGRFYARQPDL